MFLTLYRLVLRFAPLLVAVTSVGVLATAYFFQYVWGYAPCILCLYQRLPYFAALVLACLALAVPRTRGVVLTSLVPIFIAGAGVALYHTGVEYGWWELTSDCAAPPLTGMNVEAVTQQLLGQALGDCRVVPWTLGLSMAGWNVLLSLGLAVYCGLAAWAARLPKN